MEIFNLIHELIDTIQIIFNHFIKTTIIYLGNIGVHQDMFQNILVENKYFDYHNLTYSGPHKC